MQAMENYRTYLAGYVDDTLPENRIVFKALDFAVKLHSGQKRKSNEPYIIHPLSVAQILRQDLGVRDPSILASALLHDVVEDVPDISLEDIKQSFGPVVSELVDGCTKMSLQRLDRTTQVDLTHSKLLLSSSRRLGILLIKMADRLHNIKTLEFLKKPTPYRPGNYRNLRAPGSEIESVFLKTRVVSTRAAVLISQEEQKAFKRHPRNPDFAGGVRSSANHPSGPCRFHLSVHHPPPGQEPEFILFTG